MLVTGAQAQAMEYGIWNRTPGIASSPPTKGLYNPKHMRSPRELETSFVTVACHPSKTYATPLLASMHMPLPVHLCLHAN